MAIAENSMILASSVPRAAPATSIRGAPKFPKMKTQLKNRFAIKLTLEQISGTLACPTLLSTIVQVSDNPSKR